MAGVADGRFLRACRREATDTTPIWLMRQAGRYMPEYRAVRSRHAMLDLLHHPDLACEVTLQPLRAFDLDAAIIFADLLPPLAAMGLELAFVPGKGPVIQNPVRSEADVARLRTPEPEEALGFTLEAIGLVRAELEGRHLPLIGFAGAPFTLANYAVEGGASRNRVHVKQMMKNRPDLWGALMDKLATVSGAYLLAQAAAGAQALQLFDSWAGDLAPEDYRRHVLPFSQRTLATASQAGVPLIHFATGTSGMLPLFRQAGGDVVGVDWRITAADAWNALGSDVGLQGNLDPVALLTDPQAFLADAGRILDDVGGRPGHVFNLGHGILPDTPPDHVRRLVDFVHEYGRKPS